MEPIAWDNSSQWFYYFTLRRSPTFIFHSVIPLQPPGTFLCFVARRTPTEACSEYNSYKLVAILLRVSGSSNSTVRTELYRRRVQFLLSGCWFSKRQGAKLVVVKFWTHLLKQVIFSAKFRTPPEQSSQKRKLLAEGISKLKQRDFGTLNASVVLRNAQCLDCTSEHEMPRLYLFRNI